jgi:hypothetical protein
MGSCLFVSKGGSMRPILFTALCLPLLAAGCRNKQAAESGLDAKFNRIDVSSIPAGKWHEFATVPPATNGVILWAKAGLVKGNYQVISTTGQRGPLMMLDLRSGQEEAVPLKPGEKVLVSRKEGAVPD